MTDVQHDRLRALMARLEEMTPTTPEFESLGRVSSAHHRPAARTLIAVAATLAIVVAGLVVIGSKQNDTNPASPRPFTVHSIARTLPDGWEVKGAANGTADSSNFRFDDIQVFATTAAPAGPVLAVLHSGSGTYAHEDTQSNITLADGRRAALGWTYFADGRSLDVEAAAGRWVGLIARNISDADLLAIGTMARVDAQGNPSMEGLLPNGLAAIGSTSVSGGVLTNSFRTGPDQWPIGSTVSGYGPPETDAQVSIAAFVPSPVDAALLGVLGDVVQANDVGGDDEGETFVVDFGDGVAVGVYREINGVAFLARSSTLDSSRLLTMVDSLESIADEEWAVLVDRRSATEGATVDGATIESTIAPPPAYADPDDEPTRIDIGYEVSPTEDGYELSAEIPAGHLSIATQFIGRSMHIDAALDGESLGTATQDVGQGGGQYSIPRDPDGSSLYVWAAPESSPAAELRITVDGYDYSAPFITIDPTYPIRIAIVLVPPTEGRTRPATGYIYDADGNPLDSVT